MASLEPEQALLKMAGLVQAPQLDPLEFTSLFELARTADTSLACRKYIEGIEVLIRRRASPEAEIRLAYSALNAKPMPNTLAEVLADFTAQSRLARALRKHACRLLVRDSNLEIPLDALRDLSLSGDSGRLAAIDFLVTRKTLNIEHAQLTVQLIQEMNSKRLISDNTRRCEYVSRLLNLTNTASTLLSALPPTLRAAIGHRHSADVDFLRPLRASVMPADIKQSLPRIRQMNPAEMTEWLGVLRRASKDVNCQLTDKQRCGISNILGNLARTFQTHIVALDILRLAIDLEAMLSEPSEYIFDKVHRSAIATLRHADGFTVVAQGLALCARRLRLVPSKGVDSTCIARFAGVAQVLNKFSDWEPLADAVMDLQDRTARQSIGQLLILLLAPVAITDQVALRSQVDRLMRVALVNLSDASLRMQLHEAYTLAFRTCFDEEEILSYVGDEKLKNHTKILAQAVWAFAAPEPALAFERCKQLVSLVGDTEVLTKHPIEILKTLLQVHAFADISQQLNIPFVLHEREFVPMSELMAVLSAAQHRLAPLAGIHAAYRAFEALRACGSHFDASCALQTMLLRALELAGSNGVRYRAYRRALRTYMASDLQLPDAVIDTSVVEKYGEDVPLNDGLDDIVKILAASTLKRPSADTLNALEAEYKKLQLVLSDDPVLALGTESAMAIPPLALYKRRGSAPMRKQVQAQVSKIAYMACELNNLTWLDRLKTAEKMVHMGCIATSLQAAPSLLAKIDPVAAETVQGQPVLAMREYLSNQPPVSVDPESNADTPEDVICISLSFDTDNTLVVTRREHGCVAVTLRLPEKRAPSLPKDEALLSYTSAILSIRRIVEEAGSLEVKEDTPSERERFWKHQYALDDNMRNLIVSIQRSWILGFITFFSSRPGALDASEDLIMAVTRCVGRHVRSVTPKSVSLSPILAACLRDVAQTGDADQLEDLLGALFDNLVFQGAAIAVDEVDMKALCNDLQQQARAFKVSKREAKHIVLVCDRKASALPWEMLPLLQECSVTRALSLRQVSEWAAERGRRRSQLQEQARSAKVTAILDPQGNLPRTQERFASDFRLRGWTGFTGVTPTRDEFVDAFAHSSSLVYVGHGSGSMLAEPAAIRRLYLTPTGVFLFGCSSVAVQHPFFNKDVVTSYAVAGSREVLGTLWNVKDKDCNRFTAEFLSRVFDEHEHTGQALWEARKACMLPYLTAAAWVLYGLP